MIELANTTAKEITTLDLLAQQARSYSEAIATSTLQLGRVFTEARELVPYGGWAEWVQKNTAMSERHAQNLIAIYKRFGKNPAFETVQKTKLFRMLSLPESTQDQFIQTHDVAAMTTRQVEEAVKAERAKLDLQISQAVKKALDEKEASDSSRVNDLVKELSEERRDRQSAERELEQLKTSTDIPPAAREEIERLKNIAQDALNSMQQSRVQVINLQNEINDNSEILVQTQEQLNRTQKELLNLQSTMARGDAERTPSDCLDIDAFAGAVRAFIGACARMPYMQRQFAGMTLRERNDYDELLKAVQGWCRDSRKAMNTGVVEVAL